MHKLLPELLFKVFSDPYPACDATYLYATTEANQNSVIDKGVELFNAGLTKELWIADTAPKSGYVGVDIWRRLLEEKGMPAEKIIGINTHDYDMLNTYIEAFEVIGHAKKHDISSLLIVSAPFHQLRAFSTIVTAILREYPALKTYSQAGNAMAWHEDVSHSQGTLLGNRDDFIYTEIERIDKYNKKGDLADLEDIIEYLNTRDIPKGDDLKLATNAGQSLRQ